MLVVLWAWMSGIRQLLITVIHIGLDMFRTSTWLVKTCDSKCFFLHIPFWKVNFHK